MYQVRPSRTKQLKDPKVTVNTQHTAGMDATALLFKQWLKYKFHTIGQLSEPANSQTPVLSVIASMPHIADFCLLISQRRQAFMDPNQLLPEMQGKEKRKKKASSSEESSSSSSSDSSDDDDSSSSGPPSPLPSFDIQAS